MRSRRDVVVAMVAGTAALGSLAVAGWLAAHHPLAPGMALVALVIGVGVLLLHPALWLAVLPAALPFAGLAVWSGEIFVDEADVVALGVAAAAYARMAARAMRGAGTVREKARAAPDRPTAPSRTMVLLLSALALSCVVALARGLSDAVPIDLLSSQGYYDWRNSVRVAKPLALALLLLAPLASVLRDHGAIATRMLVLGCTIAAAGTSVVVVWERMLFPGLLNFSSDYRVTGPFWEMHVGGAALDGVLALALPFAVTALRAWRQPVTVVALSLGLVVTLYACLTTFSRGLYIALPVALCVLLVATARSHGEAGSWSKRTIAGTLALVAVSALVAALTFRHGGYRALVAQFVLFATCVAVADAGPLRAAGAWKGASAGVGLAIVGWVAGASLYQGPYVVFGVAAAITTIAALRMRAGWSPSARVLPWCWAAIVWLAGASVDVAFRWGGAAALSDSAIAASVVLLFAYGRSRSSLGVPSTVRTMRTIGVVGTAVAVMTVFAGGGYMAARFSSGDADLGGRLKHWRDGLGLIHTPSAWLLGRGLGRFPAAYFFELRDANVPGSFRVEAAADGRRVMLLSGAGRPAGFNELLRMSQRVVVEPGVYTLRLNAHAEQPLSLHAEICEKWLLYPQHCGVGDIEVSAANGWHTVTTSIDAGRLTEGTRHARPPVMFSLAVDSPRRQIAIDNVALYDAAGRDVLRNGTFDRGNAAWFFTSDRVHLPWHIKNLFLAVLFDQGLVGLALFVAIVAAALWRTIAGAARRHPAAPCIAASLAGFLIVGAFDSLIDASRVALLFYVVLFAALTVPASDTRW